MPRLLSFGKRPTLLAVFALLHIFYDTFACQSFTKSQQTRPLYACFLYSVQLVLIACLLRLSVLHASAYVPSPGCMSRSSTFAHIKE